MDQRVMAKQQWEEEAKDRFLVALEQRGEGSWEVSNRDVVVDNATGRNFDYALNQVRQSMDSFIPG
jgi:hypothetical protein